MSEQLTNLILELPIKTVSEINRHEHWRARHNRVKSQRREVSAEWKNAVKGRRVALPCKVFLTRIGAKELDSDNLTSALKAIRDEVASLLNVDDSPSSLAHFEYRQKAIGKREYKVQIEVQSF